MNPLVDLLILLAPFVSAILLIVEWRFGELQPRTLLALAVWFALAAYFQFFSSSLTLRPIGLVLQAALAIGLLMRLKRQ